MHLISTIFVVAILVGCGREGSNNTDNSNKLYLKSEITSLASCQMEHTDCGDPSLKCVDAPLYLGGARKCIQYDQIGLFFGCTRGELIILPDEPWSLDCL